MHGNYPGEAERDRRTTAGAGLRVEGRATGTRRTDDGLGTGAREAAKTSAGRSGSPSFSFAFHSAACSGFPQSRTASPPAPPPRRAAWPGTPRGCRPHVAFESLVAGDDQRLGLARTCLLEDAYSPAGSSRRIATIRRGLLLADRQAFAEQAARPPTTLDCSSRMRRRARRCRRPGSGRRARWPWRYCQDLAAERSASARRPRDSRPEQTPSRMTASSRCPGPNTRRAGGSPSSQRRPPRSPGPTTW